MLGEQAVEQPAHRMAAEIGGEVADAQRPLLAGAGEGPGRSGLGAGKGRHGRRDRGGMAGGQPAGQFQGQGEAEQPHRHRHRHRIPGVEPLLQMLGQPPHPPVVVVPEAESEPHALGHGEQVEVARGVLQPAGVGGKSGLGIAAGLLALAKAEQRRAMAWLLAEHPLEGGPGQIKALHLHQQPPQIEQGLGVVAIEPQQLPKQLDRLAGAVLAAQQGGEAVEQVGGVGPLQQGGAQGRLGAGGILQQLQQAGAVGQGGGVGGWDWASCRGSNGSGVSRRWLEEEVTKGAAGADHSQRQCSALVWSGLV